MRIDFRDLNNVTSLNSLGVKDAQAIWSPRLGFTNALGPYQTTVDELTTGVLVRESDPLPEDVTLSTEGFFEYNQQSFVLAKNNVIFQLLYLMEETMPSSLQENITKIMVAVLT